MLVQNNSVMVSSTPSLSVKIGVYGALINGDEEYSVKDFVRQKYPELYYIIKCESTFRPNVCSYPGCYAGQGLAQIIPSTFKRCEKHFGEDLDVFDVEDNLKCAAWLYQTEGTTPWNSSRSCWQQYY